MRNEEIIAKDNELGVKDAELCELRQQAVSLRSELSLRKDDEYLNKLDEC